MSFPLALELADRLCLVVGASEEAQLRVERFIAAGARVRWVTRAPVVPAGAEHSSARLELQLREWEPHDIDDCWLVVFADTNAAIAEALRAECDLRRRFFCAIDQTEWNSFNHVAVVQQGPVQIAVSTGGQVPALARKLRQELQRLLGDGRLAEFAARLSRMRQAAAPGERRALLASALAGLALEGRLSLPPLPSDAPADDDVDADEFDTG